jgi:lipid II:glycine glycyltransferase (peptidoglycan interpeptide bridge formation enzyme)
MYNTEILNRSEIDDNRWEEFLLKNSNGLVYFHNWYLDCVCPDWKAIIVKKGNDWLAIMPLQLKTKYSLAYSLQPLFCKYLGVIFRKDISDTYNNSLQKKILTQMLEKIPSSTSYINHTLHPGVNYLLPFYWKHYSIQPRYTYRLDLSELNGHNFSSSVKNHIRKSQKANLVIVEEDSSKSILQLAAKRKLLNKQGELVFKRLWNFIQTTGRGIMLSVIDTNRNTHSAAAFAIDGDTAYMILSIVDPTYKKLGGNSMLISKALKTLHTHGIKWFYFEGSMFENVEAYIRGYKAEPVMYFNVIKSSVPFLNSIILPLRKKLAIL